MSKKITPVDKYFIRQRLLGLKAIYIKKHGWCIPVKDLNCAIDDMPKLTKKQLVDHIFKASKREDYDPIKDEDLSDLLMDNDIRKDIGLRPLNGHDEYLKEELYERD